MNKRLGRLPVKLDKRTLRLKDVVMADLLPPLPDTFDVDVGLVPIAEDVWGNDQWGDCVICGRANWTLRAECVEQKTCLKISSDEVLNEYWKEQGGGEPDNGLVMLDSLNEWRQSGWSVSGNNYKIDAFAAIDWKDHKELEYAVMLLNGGYIGINVPTTAMSQFEDGKPWTVVPGAAIEGGHCIYIVSYNQTGPICVTWGKRQQMSWDFLDTYCEEAYAIVDGIDTFLPKSPIDVGKLLAYLNALQNV